jgi:pSer/pThr/pTyr-binding forkhead associated (FHA) protein
MTQAYILFGIRLLSALLLLIFLGGLAWIAYQDLRATAQLLKQEKQSQGFLRVLSSDNRDFAAGTLFPMLPVTTIGRAQGCTILIDDGYVSSEHAMLTQRGKQWWLEDLGSSNGTFLNDIALTEAVVLSVGDIIAIGGTRLMVEPASFAGQDQRNNESFDDIA